MILMAIKARIIDSDSESSDDKATIAKPMIKV